MLISPHVYSTIFTKSDLLRKVETVIPVSIFWNKSKVKIDAKKINDGKSGSFSRCNHVLQCRLRCYDTSILTESNPNAGVGYGFATMPKFNQLYNLVMPAPCRGVQCKAMHSVSRNVFFVIHLYRLKKYSTVKKLPWLWSKKLYYKEFTHSSSLMALHLFLYTIHFWRSPRNLFTLF